METLEQEMQKTGTINVQTENIFPIIKKFLYSDHEIFLRELVSNAVDASQKLKFFSQNGEFKGETGDLKINIVLDKENKTLTISDRGVGMTEQEIEKYINQIAFSGAEEFIEKYKDKEGAESIIGHFGLGFYSAFMVAQKVEIFTKSFQENASAVRWESKGTPEFTLQEIEKTERGTDIVLHLAEDASEFLENDRIAGILDKHCKFLPIPVIFGTKTEYIDDPNGEKQEDGTPKRVAIEVENQVNNTSPAWTKAPVELTKEDYEMFYRELYPMTFEKPLFHIHLNVDYPFKLTGILYFPAIKENVEVQRNKIALYSNQVFITDNVQSIVPDFLTLLHGVIDSPDIPLNVSRSYLQSDGSVKKISSHITKKVADKLAELFKNDREDFQTKWEDLQTFIQYGMLSEEKFAEKAKNFALLKSTDNKYYTIDEYRDKVGVLQTDKNGKVVILYSHQPDAQYGFIKNANERGYDVLHLAGPLTAHWIDKIEHLYENVTFTRVDADTLDKLIQKEEEISSKLSEDEIKIVQPIFENAIPNKDKYTVKLEAMSSNESPVIITQPEFLRRMMEQQRVGGGGFYGAFPERYNVVVNSNHKKVEQILSSQESERKQKAKQLIDLALLAQGMLTGEELNSFIERNIELV